MEVGARGGELGDGGRRLGQGGVKTRARGNGVGDGRSRCGSGTNGLGPCQTFVCGPLAPVVLWWAERWVDGDGCLELGARAEEEMRKVRDKVESGWF